MQSNTTGTVAEVNATEASSAVFFDTVDIAAELAPQFGYALSADADTWDVIDGATREDAARAAFEAERFVNEIFICEREPIAKARAFEFSVHVESILDDADTAATEHLPCAHFDGSLFASDRPALAALKARIVSACADWLRDHPGPSVWTAANITAHAREGATQ